ncbi:hypothetical protein ABT275_35190 [Streptomyces sp. NPDC001185]|uniref:hypothetical protein n=1 Tax=Streptomyces sp. NPDC001185 TaxID=3154380 RepID=UPI003330DB62
MGVQAAWDRYERHSARTAALFGAVARSTDTDVCAVARAGWAPVIEQHDVLIRRLGAWPAVDVWNVDREVALRTVREQLGSLVFDVLAADRTRHQGWRLDQIETAVCWLGQSLAELNGTLSAALHEPGTTREPSVAGSVKHACLIAGGSESADWL